MPHYDESFIHDDNQNQRRNKRSYRVYKNGLTPLNLLERSALALEERGTSVIKRNMKNIKHRNNRYKPDFPSPQTPDLAKYNTPDIIVDHCPRISVFDPNKYYDIRNNNITSLTSCKSFDNLILKKEKKKNVKDKIRNGTSLQDLADGDLKYYASPSEDHIAAHRGDARNSYSVLEARRRPMHRCFSRTTAAPGIGVYRQIAFEGVLAKNALGMFFLNSTLY